jgi:hypothetical protein
MPEVYTTTPTTTPTTPTKPLKPGWKTSEYWLSKIAMALTLVITFVPEGPAWYVKATGIAGVVLLSYGYNIGRVRLKGGGVALVLVALLSTSSSACGPSQREKTIHATYDVTNAAADQYDAYIHHRIDEIVARADKDELAAFHDKVDKIDKAFAVVWRGIATASLVNDQRSLATLVQAAVILKSELVDLGVMK